MDACIGSVSDAFEALGVSLCTRKSKTLTGGGGIAEGGVGAGGGALTIEIWLGVGESATSST